MNYKEIQELTTKELKEMISDESLQLTRMKIAHAVSPLDSPAKIKIARKKIARLKTELRTRQLSKKSE
jgi:large subunit ribosomal protein L29